MKLGTHHDLSRQPFYPEDDPFHVVNCLFEEENKNPPDHANLTLTSEPIHICNTLVIAGNDMPTQANQPTGGIERLESASHGVVPLAQQHNAAKERIIAIGQVWKVAKNNLALNGPVARLNCRVQCLDGTFIHEGDSQNTLDAMDCFMAMMPVTHLARIVELTNDNLLNQNRTPTTTGEILRFFGTLVLMTWVKFGNRRDLWRRDSGCEYLPT